MATMTPSRKARRLLEKLIDLPRGVHFKATPKGLEVHLHLQGYAALVALVSGRDLDGLKDMVEEAMAARDAILEATPPSPSATPTADPEVPEDAGAISYGGPPAPSGGANGAAP